MKILIIMLNVRISWQKICIEIYFGNGQNVKVHQEMYLIIIAWQFQEIFSVHLGSDDVEMDKTHKCQYVAGCAVCLMKDVMKRKI